MAFRILKIDNRKDAAIKSGTWSNPGAKFYDILLDSMYSEDGTIPDDIKEYQKRLKTGSIGQYDTLLKEAYLIAPVSGIHNSPYGRTHYSQSGCKYPHHVIRNGTLVVSIPGLKAAYSRAKQQGIFKGAVKEHLERHYKELGLYEDSTMTESKDSTIYLDDIVIRDATREVFGNSLSPQEMDQFLQHMKDYPDIRNLYHCEITDDDWEAIQSKMRKVARKQHLIESKLEENFQSIVSYLENADLKLKELTDKEKEKLAKADPDSYQNNNEDLVPIFGILKSYSMSKFRSDGTPKPDSEISSIKFKKFVKFITRGDNYSHALISFDSSLKEMYSFDSPGIAVDGIDDVESWKGTDNIYICVMFIPRADKMRMKRLVNLMIKHKDDTAYGFGNMIRAYISKPIKQPYQYICSSFVGFLMACSNPKNLHRDYSRFRPEDISILPRAFYVTNVTDYYDLKKRQPEIDARVNKIFTDHKEEIMEYNNELPKLFLKEKMGKLKSWDRLFDAIIKSFRD